MDEKHDKEQGKRSVDGAWAKSPSLDGGPRQKQRMVRTIEAIATIRR